MPKPYPREFREDVVAVARRRPHGTTLKQIAADFGISDSCLANWLAVADADEGRRSGPTSDDLTENRTLKRRVRLLEQENEVLRRAAAYLSQASLPPK
jgi:transposase-like protein